MEVINETLITVYKQIFDTVHIFKKNPKDYNNITKV